MIRVLVAGDLPELAKRLRDAGAEVVYTGAADPAAVVAAAVQEDAAAIACEHPADLAVHLVDAGAADIAALGPDEATEWVDTRGDRTHDRA